MKCHHGFGYPSPYPRPTRTNCNGARTLSPQCAPHVRHILSLYKMQLFFQKEIYVQVYPNTVAHRLFHILNITTPLVLSHGRYSRRTIRKNCLDARTFATKRDIKKSQLTHGVKIFIEKMHIIL